MNSKTEVYFNLGTGTATASVSLPLGRYTGGRLRVKSYVFADEFRVNPHFDLEPDYVIRKGI